MSNPLDPHQKIASTLVGVAPPPHAWMLACPACFRHGEGLGQILAPAPCERTDCVAGVGGLEPANVILKKPLRCRANFSLDYEAFGGQRLFACELLAD
jgi:hypothetical protein